MQRNRPDRKIPVDSEGAVSDVGDNADGYASYGPRQFRLNLELIVSACRSIGATPVLLTQGTLVTADNPPEDRERISYHYQGLDHEALVQAFDETYRILREVGAETGAQVIELASRVNGRSELFKDHVHTTPAGSEELAGIVALELVSHLPTSQSEAPRQASATD